MAKPSAASAVLAGLDDLRAEQEEFYRSLHQHPELSGQEHQTAAAVAERLQQAGFRGAPGGRRDRGGRGAGQRRRSHGAAAGGHGRAAGAGGDRPALREHRHGHRRRRQPGAGDARLRSRRARDLSARRRPAARRQQQAWGGTLVALFQPAEETGDGARGMVDDDLAGIVPSVDVAFAQHVMPFPAGRVGTHAGPILSAADSMRITVHGRGAHGSMPQAAVDPVVLAAMIVVRLQTVVAREVPPTETAVLTVGSIQAGTKSNVIPDSAQLQLNLRTYSDATRTTMLDAIRRIVTAECQASGSPRDPEFELFDRFPLTDNDPATTERVAGGVRGLLRRPCRDRSPQQSASEDFSDIPNALGVPYTYWCIGGIDPDTYHRAEQAGRVAQDIPVNHSATFAPVLQPTLDTGTQALVVAALAWLAR